jgi:hypothetical protein
VPLGTRPDPPVGTAKVVILGNDSGQTVENVFWLDCAGTGTYATAGLIAQGVKTAWDTYIMAQCASHYTATECIVTHYDGAFNPQGSYSSTTPGLIVSDGEPASTACVLSWKIPATWRGGRPRTYVAGVPKAALLTTRQYTSSYTASMLSAGAAFRTAVNAIVHAPVTGVELGTVSFVHANAWRTPPLFFSYAAVGVQSRICTQRRRLGPLIS